MSITRHTTAPTTTPDRAVAADLPTLVADRVVVLRGGRRPLDDVSLSLAPGELLAVGHASLDDDAAEAAASSELLVVVDRVAVTADLGEQRDVLAGDGSGTSGDGAHG